VGTQLDIGKEYGEGKVNWYVSLFGSENELKQLQNFLDSPNCRLVQFKEISTQCYLTSCRFSNLTDAKKVCESAKTLATMIKAFAKLELGGDFQSINIGQGEIIVDSKNATSIVRERVDGRDAWVFMTVVPTGTASANPVIVTINGVVQTSGADEKRLHDYYLNLCNEEINRDVIDALFISRNPRNGTHYTKRTKPSNWQLTVICIKKKIPRRSPAK